MRHIPIFTFINKMDREAMDTFELLDDIESELGIENSSSSIGSISPLSDIRGNGDVVMARKCGQLAYREREGVPRSLRQGEKGSGIVLCVTEIPLSFSISIQSDTACLAVAFPLTLPAWLMAPP